MRKIILSEDEIKSICSLIGKQLSSRYHFNDLPPVAVGVMKGAVPFTTELLKHFSIPVLVDYIQVSSFNGTESTGAVILKKDLSINVNDRDVIIIEDIVDSGISMSYLVEYISKKYHPRSIVTVSLLDKSCNRKVPFKVDFVGKELSEDDFLVGYGLDYHDLFRNIDYVFVPDKTEIEEWNKTYHL